MAPSHLSERIRTRMAKMSEGARAVAEFVIARPEDVAMLPAARVAERLGISESTVTRFAVLLGYEGYPAFRRDLQNEVRRHLAPPQRLELDQRGSAAEGAPSTRGVFEQDVENILRTQRNVTANQIDHCAELMSSARRIHVMGLRASFGLAHSLYFQLHQMLGNVTLSDFSRGETFEQMRSMSVQDLFVCFSFPRHTVLAVQAMKYARSLHARCIAITDGPLSPIATDADLLVSVHTSILDISTSLVGGYSLINAMCSEVLVRNRGRVADNLRAVEESLKAANIHMP